MHTNSLLVSHEILRRDLLAYPEDYLIAASAYPLLIVEKLINPYHLTATVH